jgi:hypothetical protein
MKCRLDGKNDRFVGRIFRVVIRSTAVQFFKSNFSVLNNWLNGYAKIIAAFS